LQSALKPDEKRVEVPELGHFPHPITVAFCRSTERHIAQAIDHGASRRGQDHPRAGFGAATKRSGLQCRRSAGEYQKDLGFSEADRVEHARRMGWLCDQVVRTGGVAIADFICPTPETRAAFLAGGEAVVIWVNRIKQGRFEDTNRLFVSPERADIIIEPEGTPEFWAEQVMHRVRPIFDSRKPTALMVGRYQPFHDGHKALIVEALKRVGQVCIAVRDTLGTDDKNPFSFEYVRARIEHGLREYEGRFVVVPVPNISTIFYGRDVGYLIERIELPSAVEEISATRIRTALAGSPGRR